MFFCNDFIETYVLLNCLFHDDFRENSFYVVKGFTANLMSFNNADKIMFLFSDENMNKILN